MGRDEVMTRFAYTKGSKMPLRRQADYIVSGDRHLRKLRRFKGVQIVSPSVFMAIVTKSFV
ncbi:MAG: hypothetical protein ACREBQ_01985 [Nitrososphaerales archaeon]